MSDTDEKKFLGLPLDKVKREPTASEVIDEAASVLRNRDAGWDERVVVSSKLLNVKHERACIPLRKAEACLGAVEIALGALTRSSGDPELEDAIDGLEWMANQFRGAIYGDSRE